MIPIQLLYIVAGFIALSAGGLQLAKLLKKKNSDEFNLGTWLLWSGTQSITTLYAISLGDPLFTLVSASWVTFYLSMSVLIIRYSSSRQTLFKSVRTSPHDASTAVPVEVAPDSASPLELSNETIR